MPSIWVSTEKFNYNQQSRSQLTPLCPVTLTGPPTWAYIKLVKTCCCDERLFTIHVIATLDVKSLALSPLDLHVTSCQRLIM